MSVSIDMKSVLGKAKDFMESDEGEKRAADVKQKVMSGRVKLSSGQSIHTPEEAADKFIGVLRQAINSSGLSDGAIAAVSNIDHGDAHKVGNDEYDVYVYFTGDMYRPSLDEDRYGGINDIVSLFNDGAKGGAPMHTVVGQWHEKTIRSKTVIPGTHFIQQAISDFMGNYASDYNVTSIEVLDA